jgi:LmbE family N-acetylglucosaminyl deacetylase
MRMDHRAPTPAALEAPDSGTVLVLAPHPDDEVIGCGGTLCLHAAQGDRVHVLVAFGDGESDEDGQEGGELAETRRTEARAGGAELGIRDYEFWDVPEGLDPEPVLLQLASRRLAARIAEIAPRTVYAPWIGEHPIDHHVLARAALLALEMADFDGRAWGYEVWTPLVPTRIVDITPVWERKRAAIVRHASQLRHGDLVHRTLGLNAQRSSYLARRARYGEAFAPLLASAESLWGSRRLRA